MESLLVGSCWADPQMSDAPNPWVTGGHPWLRWIEARRSDAGVLVTPQTALEHTPLWHGLLLLGGDAGSLDIQLKELRGELFSINTTHTAYQLVSVRPNRHMCPASFWEMMVPRAILWGNAIAEITRNRSGGPLSVSLGGGLVPLAPDTTMPFFDQDGKLWIETGDELPRGGRGPKRFIDPDDVFHLPSLSTDGFWGLSLAHVARNRIANGLGINKQHNRFMANGMQPDWLFSYPIALDVEDQSAVEEKLRRENRGLENVGRSLVLDNDVKAMQLGMSFEAAQFVELAQLDVQMTASLLGIPAVMLNSMDKMTFNNTEESERWYINRTLRRWLNKITQESAAKLLNDRERERFTFQHNLDPLLKGRLLERFEAYSKGIASRFLNPNEVRAEEGLNPYDGGDVFENPNTSSGVQADESAEPPEQKLAAARLKAALRREDDKVSEACRGRNGDLFQWMDEFYHGEMLRELFEIVPNSAESYCDARYRLWVKFSGHVQSGRALSDLVRAQKQTASDRIAGLLTEEFRCQHALT